MSKHCPFLDKDCMGPKCMKFEWLIKPNKELKHKGRAKCTAVIYYPERRAGK